MTEPSKNAGMSASGTSARVRLASVRLAGFRGIDDLEIPLDPVTTIIGEHGATKAAVVDLLALCLGPAPEGPPRFAASDLAPIGARGRGRAVRVTLTFVEAAVGAWEREPALLRVATRRRDRLHAVEVKIGAEATQETATGPLRIETSLEVGGARGGGRRDAARNAWARLRTLSPVLVVGAARPRRDGAFGEVTARPSPRHAEIMRLYRKMRASDGRLSAGDIDSARAMLRDELRRGATRDLILRDERALVDVVDWQRPVEQDVTDDAVQDVLMRLLRAGLMLEAQTSGVVHEEASPIVVVDSPDARLHPILAARVWRFLHSVASQVIVTTNSSEVVAASPLRAIRRIVRNGGRVQVTRIDSAAFSIDDLRRLIYHVRLKRGSNLLARTWFLVEGETEIWILSEFAAMLGYSFAAEGVACVEFAQCGLSPLLRLADQLGIGWHVLADGDPAGVAYANQARAHLAGRSATAHVTMLDAADVENVLWKSGYADVFRQTAGALQGRHLTPRATIGRAIARASKPLLAIRVIERALQPGSPGVPARLAAAIEASVALARGANRPATAQARLNS